MSVKERLREDMKTAMKEKNDLALSTIRMMISAIKNREIEQIKELDDTETLAVLQKAVKQRLDSAQQYKAAGRLELAQKEEEEIKILERYLPKGLSQEQITTLVKEAIGKSGAASMKDIGKVMGILMPQVKGKADGGQVNAIVKQLLGG
ncbi:MAG: GatB/YqeY domain-containing protein [Nitrospinota bacterium]|nr:GatB/YqeY domain-containing protein [Nitrospinota bacterium]